MIATAAIELIARHDQPVDLKATVRKLAIDREVAFCFSSDDTQVTLWGISDSLRIRNKSRRLLFQGGLFKAGVFLNNLNQEE